MTDSIHLDDLQNDMSTYLEKIKAWNVWVYPTDSIYGIWGIATRKVADRIYQIKHRDRSKPVSVIAPSIDRINTHCKTNTHISQEINAYLDTYHAITLLIAKRDPNTLDYLAPGELLGVRILQHPRQDIVTTLWEPYITTSANRAWADSPHDYSGIDAGLLDDVDLAIDDGKLHGTPSVLIDYQSWEILSR